jgi:hypothetical protein
MGGKKRAERGVGLRVEGFGHEVALVIEEAAAAVEFDGGISVGDFEMKIVRVMLAGNAFGEIEKLGANSLPAMGLFDEKLVNPGALALIFEAIVETDDEIGDGSVIYAREIGDAEKGIVEELGKIFLDDGVVEGLGPGIVGLHELHEGEQIVEFGGSGELDGDGHDRVTSSASGRAG